MAQSSGQFFETLGFGFNPTDSRILANLQKKFSTDYLPLVLSLDKSTGGTNKKLKNTIELFQRIVKNIGLVNSGKVTGETGNKLLLKIFEDLDNADNEFDWLKYNLHKDTKTGKSLKDIEKRTGVKYDELTKGWKEVKSFTQKIQPKKFDPLEFMQAVSPEGYDTGKDVLLGGVQAALGPFAEMAYAGSKGAFSVGKAIHSYFAKRKEARLTEALMPQMEGKSGALASPVTGEKPVATMRGVYEQKKTPTEKLSGKALENASDPIYYFFDKVAYKASWTSSVLKLLKGITDGEKGGGLPGSLGAGMIGGMLSRIVPFIGPALLGVSTVALGVLANKMEALMRQRRPDIAQKMDLFKFAGLPGMNLLNPIQGPKQMAEAYAKLTQDVMGKLGPALGKMFSSKTLGLGALSEQFTSLSKVLKPFSDQIKKFGEIFQTAVTGIVSVVPKPIRDKLFPSVEVPDRVTVQDVTRAEDSRIKSEKVVSPMAVANNSLAEISRGLAELQKTMVVPSAAGATSTAGSSGVGETNEFHYGQRDPLTNGINSGNVGLNNE